MSSLPHRPHFIAILYILQFQLNVATSQHSARGVSACAPFVKEGDPTICHELQTLEDESIEYEMIGAEGTLTIEKKLYPKPKSLRLSLIGFDEPLGPIPVGTSVYFFMIVVLFLIWYFKACTQLLYKEVHRELRLRPEPARFPHLPLYWLQQTKRELSLKREVRTTWAWLAKRYLLSPDDPLLTDIDEVMGKVTWGDFNLPRDTWSLINVVLKFNQLYFHVKTHPSKSKKTFKIVKDEDGPAQDLERVPSELLPKRFREHENRVYFNEANEETETLIDEEFHPGVVLLKAHKNKRSLLGRKNKLRVKSKPGVTKSNKSVRTIKTVKSKRVRSAELNQPKKQSKSPSKAKLTKKKKKSVPPEEPVLPKDTEPNVVVAPTSPKLKKKKLVKTNKPIVKTPPPPKEALPEVEKKPEPPIPEKNQDDWHNYPKIFLPPVKNALMARYLDEQQPGKLENRLEESGPQQRGRMGPSTPPDPVGAPPPPRNFNKQSKLRKIQLNGPESVEVIDLLSHAEGTTEEPKLIVHHEQNGDLSFELTTPSGMVPSGNEAWEIVVTKDKGEVSVTLQRHDEQAQGLKNKKRKKPSQ